MPEPAVRPETPPTELSDRSEGWGSSGSIRDYPTYVDNGTWPAIVVHLDEYEPWPSEVYEGNWYHLGELLFEEDEEEPEDEEPLPT